MQDAVSNNLLQSISGTLKSQSGDPLVQSDDQRSPDEALVTFEQLVADVLVLTSQTPVNSVDPVGEQKLISGQLSVDQTGKTLPEGNRQAAMLAAIQSNQTRPDVLPQVSTLLPESNKALATPIVELTTLLKDKLEESASGRLQDSTIYNKLNRNLLLLQHGPQQPAVNQLTPGQISLLDFQNDSKISGKSFTEMIDFGLTKLLDSQGKGSQLDDAVKSLLSSVKTDGGTQLETGRTDASVLYTNQNSITTSKPTLSMSVPFGATSAWQQSFGEKVMWMVNKNIQGAEIKLNPPELGPLQVKITMQQDLASIQFTSQNHQVREIIESAIPRLREMFGDSGINLADVDVSDKSPDNNNRSLLSSDQTDEQTMNGNDPRFTRSEDDEIIEHNLLHTQELGRIDYYV